MVRLSKFATLAAVLLLLFACNGDDEERDAALADLVAEDLVGSQQDGAIAFDEDQADCVADGFVDEFGGDQLRDWGYDEVEGETPEGDLTIEDAGQRERAWQVLVTCVDVPEQVTQILAAGGTLDEEQSRCVADRYVASDVAAHAVFGPGDPDVNAEVDELLESAVEACE